MPRAGARCAPGRVTVAGPGPAPAGWRSGEVGGADKKRARVASRRPGPEWVTPCCLAALAYQIAITSYWVLLEELACWKLSVLPLTWPIWTIGASLTLRAKIR